VGASGIGSGVLRDGSCIEGKPQLGTLLYAGRENREISQGMIIWIPEAWQAFLLFILGVLLIGLGLWGFVRSCGRVRRAWCRRRMEGGK